METNQFIEELERIHIRFSETDYENNTWNGFICNMDGAHQYEKHIKNLYTQYFNQLDRRLIDLLISGTSNSVLQVISHLTTKMENIKAPLTQYDEESKKDIDKLSEFEKEYTESADSFFQIDDVYWGNYDKDRALSIGKKNKAQQLEYDFLTFNIDFPKFRTEIEKEEWSSEDRWCEKERDGLFCRLLMERFGREYLEKSLTRLKELSDNYSTADHNQQVSLKNRKQVEAKDFVSYLHHGNKDALMEKLHELLDGKKGKLVATIIIALEKLSFIGGYETRSSLYNSMKNEFGNIGEDSGLNDFISKSYKISDKDLNRYIDILKKVG